jgi:hypothetical protein
VEKPAHVVISAPSVVRQDSGAEDIFVFFTEWLADTCGNDRSRLLCGIAHSLAVLGTLFGSAK